MIHSITNLTRTGLKDWFIQRVSAVILAAYVLFLVGYLFGHSGLDYGAWKALFQCTWMRDFTLLAVLSLIAHAWIGMWTIFTDYIHCAVLRSLIQVIVVIAFLVYFVWTIAILWG